MAGGDHGLYTRRCQVEDRWLSFRGRIEIFISILPEDLKVFRYTHEEKLTLPKFGIALKSLSAFDLCKANCYSRCSPSTARHAAPRRPGKDVWKCSSSVTTPSASRSSRRQRHHRSSSCRRRRRRLPTRGKCTYLRHRGRRAKILQRVP